MDGQEEEPLSFDLVRAHPAEMSREFCAFFTVWSGAIVALSAFFPEARIHEHVHLLFMTLVVGIVSTYISHVYPRKYYWNVAPDHTVVLYQSALTNAIIHWAPVAYVLYAHGTYYMTRSPTDTIPQIAAVFIIFAIYMACFVDVDRKYRLRREDMEVIELYVCAVAIAVICVGI
jgi:hypothetical protein